MLHMHSALRNARAHAVAEIAAERTRRRAFDDVQYQARDHRREVRANMRALREETRERRGARADFLSARPGRAVQIKASVRTQRGS